MMVCFSGEPAATEEKPAEPAEEKPAEGSKSEI